MKGEAMYAVLGSPIRHSLSPQIFKLFANQLKQRIDYQAVEVEPENLATTLRALRQKGYKGVNLTSPLKEPACVFADRLSEQGRAAGAVNILSFQEDGSCYGHNSDGIGFIRDLTKIKKYPIQGKSVLILGAGGAVRGIMPALLQENPREVVIFNRTEAKARRLIEDFQWTAVPLSFSRWQLSAVQRFDLIVNCTTLGLQGQVPVLSAQILNQGGCYYDLAYGEAAREFLAWSRRQGWTHCYDGLGMLVEQAAEAFYLWRQRRVETKNICRQLQQVAQSS